MAQPQGLNVPAIITTGIVTVVLVATVVEGVRAYYYFTENQEIERKANGGTELLANTVKREQTLAMERSSVTIDAAMKRLVEGKGQLPATRPAK
jgi:hypothetical protein